MSSTFTPLNGETYVFVERLPMHSASDPTVDSVKNDQVSKRNPLIATFLGLEKEQAGRPVVKKKKKVGKPCKTTAKNTRKSIKTRRGSGDAVSAVSESSPPTVARAPLVTNPIRELTDSQVWCGSDGYMLAELPGLDYELQEELEDEDLLSLIQKECTTSLSTASALPTDLGSTWSQLNHTVEGLKDFRKEDMKDPHIVVQEMLPPTQKPIVRPFPPKTARDRSPVAGLTTNEIIRTCFRIGEALKDGCSAVRTNRGVIVELYARVIASYRKPEQALQHYVFADLFHNHPPFLTGTYDEWKGVELWDADSAAFLEVGGTGRICRCVARMKREGDGWNLKIINIWEATWEDICYVRGIL